MSNLIKFDLETEAKHSSNAGGLAADFWKGAEVEVTISTWTKTLDNKTSTSRAKNGNGMLGCWLTDSNNNKGWANLSLIGKLMMESFNGNQKKSWFKKDADKDDCIELDTPRKILIEMDDKDRPNIIRVGYVASQS